MSVVVKCQNCAAETQVPILGIVVIDGVLKNATCCPLCHAVQNSVWDWVCKDAITMMVNEMLLPSDSPIIRAVTERDVKALIAYIRTFAAYLGLKEISVEAVHNMAVKLFNATIEYRIQQALES